MKLRVLDLFSGTGSFSKPFFARGHYVTTLDNEKRFDPTICADIMEVVAQDLPGPFDVVLASPPCQMFSMAGSGKGNERWIHIEREMGVRDHLFGPRLPARPEAIQACALVIHTIGLIASLSPSYWWMENPQGGLKTMGFMKSLGDPVTVTYCAYGGVNGVLAMKPTTLWGKFPDTWKPRPRCHNGDPCHERAPRGARTGTQSHKNADLRGMLPYELGTEICKAVEKEMKDASG